MFLRNYTPDDNEVLTALFIDTVHTVCTSHYTPEELEAWAPHDLRVSLWCQAFTQSHTLVAQENGTVIGFGNITEIGLVDRLFVHKNHLRKGVATHILFMLEEYAIREGLTNISVFASRTARPFFEKQGFTVIRENVVHRNGEELINYEMQKRL